MKKNSALRKMPEIVKGGGGYTYKYTSSEEQSQIGGKEGLSDLMVRPPILEVKGPNSKGFKKISIDSDAGKAIMKEIKPKLKNVYKDKILPIMEDVDPGKLVPAVKMKRRGDGSVAKLKNESFMKRMKRLNKASSPVMKKGKKSTFFNPIIDGLVTINKIKNIIKDNMPEYGGIGRDSDKFKREFRKYVKESNKNPKKYPPISSDEFTAKDFIK